MYKVMFRRNTMHGQVAARAVSPLALKLAGGAALVMPAALLIVTLLGFCWVAQKEEQERKKPG